MLPNINCISNKHYLPYFITASYKNAYKILLLLYRKILFILKSGYNLYS